MGWGFVGDFADAVGDTVSAAGSAVADAADDAFDYGSGAVTSAGGSLWSGALSAIGTVEDISPDVPWVDIEVEAGQLSAGVHVAGYGAGIGVGEHGVEARYDAGVMGSAHVGITDEGFDVGLAIGDTDWPQWMPAVAVGAGGDWDGNVRGSYEAQGAVPIPGANGVVWGEVAGDFERNEDGTWGVSGHAEGSYLGLDGTRAGAGVYGSYTRTEDGSVTTAGASGYYARDDLYIGGSVDYARLRAGDDILESLDAAASFSGYGVEAQGGLGYRHAEIDGDEMTHFEAHGEASGRGLDASGSATFDEFSTGAGTVSSWETDYSIDGVEELAGEGLSTAAAQAGLELDGVDAFGADPAPALDDLDELDDLDDRDAPTPPSLDDLDAPEPEPAPVFEAPEPVLVEAAPEPAVEAPPEPAPAPEPSPLDELDDL